MISEWDGGVRGGVGGGRSKAESRYVRYMVMLPGLTGLRFLLAALVVLFHYTKGRPMAGPEPWLRLVELGGCGGNGIFCVVRVRVGQDVSFAGREHERHLAGVLVRAICADLPDLCFVSHPDLSGVFDDGAADS